RHGQGRAIWGTPYASARPRSGRVLREKTASSICRREHGRRVAAPGRHRAARGSPARAALAETGSLVVVATRAVHVTVRQLLGGGVAHVDHVDVEVQRLAGQRVVAVDRDLAILDLGDGDDLYARRGLGLETHPGLDLFDALEHFQRHFLGQRLVPLAVGFRGRYPHRHLFTRLLAFQRLFQAWDDVAGAMEIGERSAALGGIEDTAPIVSEGVVD